MGDGLGVHGGRRRRWRSYAWARTEAGAGDEARGRGLDLEEGWAAGASRLGWKVGSGEQLDL